MTTFGWDCWSWKPPRPTSVAACRLHVLSNYQVTFEIFSHRCSLKNSCGQAVFTDNSDNPAAAWSTWYTDARQVSNKPRSRCQFCGIKLHPRSKCPDKNCTCQKGSKAGHCASVCRSIAAVLQTSPDDELETAVLCSTGLLPVSLNISFNFRVSNQPVPAMIHNGFTSYFISFLTTAKYGLEVCAKQKIGQWRLRGYVRYHSS